nr:unnamed protein product [Haemonchus contortus]
MDPSLTAENDCSFDEFASAFWFLAFCGCLTRRRYIIVFTTLAMFYTFVLAFKWFAAASFSYLTNTPLSCPRHVRQTYPSWCRDVDIIFLAASVISIMIAMVASILSALRLWSDEDDFDEDDTEEPLVNENQRPTRTMITSYRYSIDRQLTTPHIDRK